MRSGGMNLDASSAGHSARLGPRLATALFALLATALLAPTVAHAQDASSQITLRDRWRVSLDAGAYASLGRGRIDVATAQNDRGFLNGSLAVSAWRAVHPWIDLGGRVGLRFPDVRQVEFYPIDATCPSGLLPAMLSDSSRVIGLAPHAMLGARVRPGGPRLPLHLVVGAVASAWVMPSGFDARWQCSDGITPVGAPSVQRVGGGVAFSVSGLIGLTSHFGASEEFSIGLEYWQHLAVTDAYQYALGLTFGWEMNRASPLPLGARGRGARPSAIVGVVGGVLVFSGFLVLTALSSIG